MYRFMISFGELLKLQQRNRVTLLDLRDRASYQKGHIPCAVSVPFEDNPNFTAQVPKNGIVVLYCYRGNLSVKAAGLLRKNGCQAYSLAGGYEAYRKQENRGK